MSEYTPDTERVREAYEEFYYDEAMPDAKKTAVVSTEFDRWLAEVERAAAEKAWDEGVASAIHEFDLPDAEHWDMDVNPYRRNEGESE